MKAVVQKVKYASVSVDGKLISRIDVGFLVFLGVKVGDSKEKAEYLAKKISALRIFEDENGKMNKSLFDVGGKILAVSQFTLLADTSHGNRPGFTDAELPQKANVVCANGHTKSKLELKQSNQCKAKVGTPYGIPTFCVLALL